MAKKSDCDLSKPVEVYPCKTVGVTSFPLEGELYEMDPEVVNLFVQELERGGHLNLIEASLQGLAERND